MFDDYSERLFAHFVGGYWRVPFSDETHAVLSYDGAVLGQVVAAGPRDVARAVHTRRGADRQACRRLADALEHATDELAQACALQSGHLPELTQFARMAAFVADPSNTNGGVLFSARDTRLEDFGRAVGAGVLSGVIWCPPIDQAVFATALACLVQHSDLPPGAFTVLHTRVAKTEAALRATGLAIHDC